MPLAPGTRFGAYEVQAFIGAGGMGEVYRARDSRLDRIVALKVLPADKVGDDERQRRFLSEAKTVSALNHPNIVQLYDVVEETGTFGLVMEYVAGKSLDNCIPKKGMPIGEAVHCAIQIAEGLAAAHQAGVVHRDLKPANVLLTESGLVKLVDFGVAKLTDKAGDSGEATVTAAEVRAQTREGTIVGTIAYMSPEQAQAQPVDTRSDVFSFGAVFYEMVTGRRAFQGETAISTLTSILRDHPKPVTQLAKDVPRDIEKVIATCLRKDMSRRWQSILDVRNALEEWKTESQPGSIQVAPARYSKRRAWILAAAVATIVLLVAAAWQLTTARPLQVIPSPAVPVPLTAYEGFEDDPAFSPDGSQIAFSWDAGTGANHDLYVKLIGPGEPLRLTYHVGNDWAPSWSPDGRWIAFVRTVSDKRSLMLIPALGGAERMIAGPLAGGYSSWSPDSRWLLASMAEGAGEPGGLFLLSVDSADRRRLTSVSPPVSEFGGALSPDGRLVAFVRRQGSGADVYKLRISAELQPQGVPARIDSPGRVSSNIAWTADGHVVFSATTTGGSYIWMADPAGSAPAIQMPATEGAGSIAIAPTAARLAYSRWFSDSDIFRIPLKGREQNIAPLALITSTYADSNASYSPDGKHVVFVSARSGDTEIWKAAADGTHPVQLTFHRAYSGTPRWSPDTQMIAYDSTVSSRPEVYIMRADGGDQRQVTKSKTGAAVPAWSADGKTLYFRSADSGRDEIWKMNLDDGTSAQVTRTGVSLALVSPDGKHLYFTKSMYNSGVWRWSLENGGEERVLEKVFWRSFALTASGIWYIIDNEAKRYELRFVPYSGGEPRMITSFRSSPGLGFSVSPDERWAVLPQTVREGSDLMLIEGFR